MEGKSKNDKINSKSISTMLNNINFGIISKVFAHTKILEKHNILAKKYIIIISSKYFYVVCFDSNINQPKNTNCISFKVTIILIYIGDINFHVIMEQHNILLLF